MNKGIKKRAETVGILGYGEIGKAVAQICKEAGYIVYARDLNFDDLKGKKVQYLHVNIPEKDPKKFVNVVLKCIEELEPKLTIINSSVTPGVSRKIQNSTTSFVVHSPVIGVHPHLYESIRHHFPKIIGPTSDKAGLAAKRHLKSLGLKVIMYDSSENSESAKLLDLVYYAWNIIFCKWMEEICKKEKLNFDQIYTLHNKIYNEGYKDLRANVLRPILRPIPGPIGGHCTIPDTEMFDKFLPNRFTKFILKENSSYEAESK